MIDTLFYWTGAIMWLTIVSVATGVFLVAVYCWFDREIVPSVGNLRFFLFGKSRREHATYYKLWAGMARWHYFYYTRGSGKRHFSRYAMKRLIREARKESLRKAAETVK